MKAVFSITFVSTISLLLLASVPSSQGRLGSTTLLHEEEGNGNNDDRHHRHLKSLQVCGSSSIDHSTTKHYRILPHGQKDEADPKVAFVSGGDNRVEFKRLSQLDPDRTIFTIDRHNNRWVFYHTYTTRYSGRDDDKIEGMNMGYTYSDLGNRGEFYIQQSTNEEATDSNPCLDKIVLTMEEQKCTTMVLDVCREYNLSHFHVKKNDDKMKLVNNNRDADWFTIQEVQITGQDVDGNNIWSVV